jgi:hypothetical protein
MANEKYSEIKTMPSSSSSSTMPSSSMPSSTLSEQERQHNELIATRIDTK